MSEATPTYKKGERVLCYHGIQIYEAKILEVRDWERPAPSTKQEGLHYLVHYQGWKNLWDEWIAHDSERLLKFTDANLTLQKTIQNTKSRDSTGGMLQRKKLSTARGTKRGRDEMESGKAHPLRLDVPHELKAIFVKDHQAVTVDKLLITLPRSPTVQEILSAFRDWILSTDPPPPNVEVVPLIVSGLQTYFDRALGNNLLYAFEKQQHADIRALYITGQNVVPGTDVDMSTIYGAEHLLRMLVGLPRYIAGSALDNQSISIIQHYVQELFKYMTQEKETLFQAQYQPTDEHYQKLASATRLR